MLQNVRFILSAVVLLLLVYGLIMKNYASIHIMVFFYGLMMLIKGLEEFRKDRKMYGGLCFVVFSLSLVVTIKRFLWN